MSSMLLVTGEKGRSLLGHHLLSSLQYCSIFKDDLGTLKDFEAKIYVDLNAKPN